MQAAATELAVATEALPDGTTGFAYAATLEATGGTAPYSWSVPVAGGYLETSAASTFAETGTAQGWKSDAGSWELALPFAFPYFGNTYTKVRVYSNGTLWFSDDDYADYLNELYGHVSEVFLAIPVIIPQWTLMSTANGDIYVDSGADAVTIRWQGEDQGAPMNFSATLQADGQIVLSYGAGNANGGAIGLGVGDYETAPQLSAKSQSGSMENADDIVFTPMPGCYSETGAASTFAETGTAQGWQSDAGGWDLALPFAFPFFGNTHTNLRVYSNGTLWFSDFDYAGYISEGYLPEAFKYYPVIAPLWSQAGTANGDIYVESGADAVTIRWQGEEGDAAVNFAATLHADGKIVLSYGAGNANGGGIAIGAGDGKTAAQISAKSQSGSMENANDIVFTPNNDFLPMPGWLQLSADGALQGAPDEAGDYSFTVIVTDAAGAVAQTNLTLAVAASTAGEAAVDGTTWSYIANGTEAMVTGASAAEGHVTVPSELGGCPVTTIGPEAFSENTTMTGLTIPDSVTTLCAGAFQYCSALETVSLGNGLRVIGDSFYGCQALTEVVFGTGLETITDGAFRSSGVTQLVFPDSLRVVTSNAFRGCSGLTNIVWGAGIESIGDYAFYSCRALGSVTIPDSVTNIGSAAFAYCSALTNAVIGDGVAEIGAYAFNECSKLAEVTFGSHVARIGQSAFYYCVKLAEVGLPDSLTDLGPSAFAITPLTSVTIPDSVTNIGSSAFYRCQLMTTATLGKHVESLGSNAFYDCPLETITIPASLQGSLSAASVRSECMVIVLDDEREEEVVDGRTWYYVTENGAATVKGADPAEGALTVPATLGGCPVTAIGGWAFAGCDGLTGVTIPGSVTNLGAGAFQNCTALQAVALGNGLREIGENAFFGCTALTEIAFGTGIETIGSGAFQNSGLVQVALPNGLRVVATNAFRGSASLTNIVWSAGIESIEAYAFAECTALTEVVVPGSVASIGYCAFYRCLGLATATVGMNVESIGYSVFSGCPLTTLYAPFALEGQLVNAGIPWSCTVVEWAVVDGRTWQYIVGDGVATVTGVEPAEGALAVPATLGGRTVTGIAAGAFAGSGVTEAVLPDGVASIGEGAFDAPNFTRLEVGGALQDAVWAVPEGPEVRIEVRAGTYGPIETSNKVVRIVGLEGAEATVIDAAGTGGRCALLVDTNIAYTVRVSGNYNSVGCQTNSVLEGFTLTGAAVAGDGGGVFGGTLVNCVVVSNQASYGGGLAYGNAFGCRFEGNEASSWGGALYGGALAEDCVFTGNRAGSGGAASQMGCLRGCEIRGNEATDKGGGAYDGGTMENCQVVGNRAGGSGGGIYGFEIVRDSRIVENEVASSSVGWGGGIYGLWDGGVVSNCVVSSNRVTASSGAFGGGIYETERLVGCEVSDNVAESSGDMAIGGGVFMDEFSPSIAEQCVVRGNAARTAGSGSRACAKGGAAQSGTWRNCTIADNVAEGETAQGGGLQRTTAVSCEISGNRATTTLADGEAEGGGAHYSELTGCVVSNNEAQWGGGTYSGSATGCTIIGNRADTGGGACYGTLVNCIVTKNHAATGGGWYPGSGSHNTFTLNETDTEDSYSPAWGANNTLVWGETVAGSFQTQIIVGMTEPTIAEMTMTVEVVVDGEGNPWLPDASSGTNWTAVLTPPEGYSGDILIVRSSGDLYVSVNDPKWGLYSFLYFGEYIFETAGCELGMEELMAGVQFRAQEMVYRYQSGSATPIYADSPCPMVDPENGDYRLLAGSAAIDAGSPTTLVTDLAGNPRTQGEAPDLGALEADHGGIIAAGQVLVLTEGRGKVEVTEGETSTTATALEWGGRPFLGWKVDGEMASAERTYTWESAAGFRELTAVFGPGDIWVDAIRGDDTNDGSEAAPLATLQAAVALAFDGDRVRARPGTYDPFLVAGKTIEIAGVEGAERTRIHGNLQDRCATLGNPDDLAASQRTSVLKGFTLRYGTGTRTGVPGAAAMKGRLEDCIIKDCGVFSADSTGTYNGDTSIICNAELVRCTITGCVADALYEGDAKNCDTLAVGNEVRVLWRGGDNRNLTLAGNLVRNLLTTNRQGRVSITPHKVLDGGSYCNSIVWGNGATNAGTWQGGWNCIEGETPREATESAGPIWADDPEFVDEANGDFRLSSVSPYVDVGNNNVVESNTDLAGKTRIDGETVDLGCYEGRVPTCEIAFTLGEGLVKLDDRPLTGRIGKGEDATPPEVAAVSGWRFEGWTPGLEGVQVDTDFIAETIEAPSDWTVEIHGGRVETDATWGAGAVHVVTGTVTVASGRTLTIAAGAVVKFAPGAKLVREDGGMIVSEGATFTHLFDDEAGGDTLDDGAARMPVAGEYEVQVDVPGPGTEFRYGEASQETTPDDLPGEIVWKPGEVHVLAEGYTVPLNKTLRLKAGAIVKVGDGQSILVYGTLIAEGTAAKPVVITSMHDDEHGGDTDGDGGMRLPSGGDWTQILVQGTASFNHCSVLYGSGRENYGGIEVSSGSVTFDNGEIAHMKYECVNAHGGRFTARNTVFWDSSLGFGYYGGQNVKAYNCVFHGLTAAIRQSGKQLVNCVFSECLAFTDQNGDGSRFEHCVFWNPAGYGAQSDAHVGQDGNIWGDPKFADTWGGDFHVLEGSPCIDAGDGAAAPERDLFGNTRVTLKGEAATGLADENGAVPDIGVHEYGGRYSGGDDVDAVPTEMRVYAGGDGPLAPGDAVMLVWRLESIGSGAFGGVWTDRVTLTDGAGRRVVLGEQAESGRIEPGTSKLYSGTFEIPPLMDGEWALGVEANVDRGVLEGANTENNRHVSTNTVAVSNPAVAADGGTFEARGGETLVRVEGVPGEGGLLGLEANGMENMSVLGTSGNVPAASRTWPVLNGSGEAWMPMASVPATNAVYLLVNNPGAPETVTLSIGALETRVTGVSPTTLPCSTPAALTLEGTGLRGVTAVELWKGDAQVAASTDVAALSDTKATATFALAEVAPGTYSAKMRVGDEVHDVPGAVELAAVQIGPQLKAWLELPKTVRDGRVFTGYVCYQNTGDADMVAPLFAVSGQEPTTKVSASPSANMQMNKAYVIGASPSVPKNILKAGESGHMPFYFTMQGTYHLELIHISETGAADAAAFVNQWWEREQKAALAMQQDAEAEVLRQAALENLAQELAAAVASAPAEPATATLSGTFVEETTGLPITNGTLHAMSGTGIILGEWTTDETGAFAYTVVTPGMVATLQSDEYELPGEGAGPYTFEGEQNIVVTGRLRGVVSGQVVEAGTTNGVVNLPVRLVPEAEGAWERKANTDENGCFEMRGLDDGAYTLTTAAGFAWQPAAGQRIELSATNRAATVVLEVAPGLSWMGTLLQEGTSNGVAGVHLRLCDTNKATLAEATTDEDGDFVFAGLAAGDYVVWADGARWAIVPEDANVRLEGDDPLHEGDLHAGRGRLFRAMPEIGVAPLEVAFTVLLTEETKDALAFAWDLDGDGVVDSTDVLPTWTYGEAGTNDVALMVTLADGSVVTNVQPACVTVRPAIPTLYRDGVVVLTEGAPENTGDYQIASWTNGTLTLTRLTAEPKPEIAVGTKLFFDPGGDLPYALLRVTAIVSETGAETVLSTETVPFSEIFRSFSMKLASSPEPGPGPSGRRGGRHAKTIRDLRKSGELPGDLGGETDMGSYLPIEGTKHFDFAWSMLKETRTFKIGFDVDLHNTLVYDGSAWLLLGGMGYQFNLEDILTYKAVLDATLNPLDEHVIFVTQDLGSGWCLQLDGNAWAKLHGAAGVKGEEKMTLSSSDQLRFDETGAFREGTHAFDRDGSLEIFAEGNAGAGVSIDLLLRNNKLGENTWIKMSGFMGLETGVGYGFNGKEGFFSKHADLKRGVTLTMNFDWAETIERIVDGSGSSDGVITLENVMQKLHMPELSLSALQARATALATEKMAALNIPPALVEFLKALVKGKDLEVAVGSLADGWEQLIVKELAKELGIPEEFQNYSFGDFVKKLDEYKAKLPEEMGQLMSDLNGLAEAGVLDSSGAQREALKEYLSRGTVQADFPVLRQIVNIDAAEGRIVQILQRLSEARNQVLAARADIMSQLGDEAKERLNAIAPELAENWNQVDAIRNALSGDLQQRVNQIKAQLDDYQNRLYTYVDEQRNNLEAEVPFSESDVTYVKNALDTTRSELDAITQNIHSLQEDITSIIRGFKDLTTPPKTRALRPLPAHRRAARRGGDPTLEALHRQIVALDSGISQISSQIQTFRDQFDETAGSIRAKAKVVSGFLEKAQGAIGSKDITKRRDEIAKLLENLIAEKVAQTMGMPSDSLENALAMIKTASDFKAQLIEQSKKVKQYKDEYRAALRALQQALNGGQAEAINKAKKELQNVQNEMNGSIESLGTAVGNKFKGFQIDVGNELSVFMTAAEVLPALMDTAKGIRISSAESLQNAGEALLMTVKPVYEKVNLGADAQAIVQTLDAAKDTWNELSALYGKAMEFKRNRQVNFNRRSARDLSGENAFDWASTGADGMSTCAKLLLGLELDAIDSDGDGMMDVWEDQWTLSPLDKTGADGAQGDPDDDGLANIEEYRGRSPKAGAQTSGKRRDGESGDDGGAVSGWPSAQATYPTHPDTDGGGVIDSDELLYELDPFDPADDKGICKTCADTGNPRECTCLDKFGTSSPVKLVDGQYHCECGGCPDCQPVDDGKGGQPVQSCDPNDIIGPLGFGDPEAERYVGPGAEMEYTIFFENKADAAAAAQEVRVTLQLDGSLDWGTFEAGSVMANNTLDEGLVGSMCGTSQVTMATTAYDFRTTVGVDTNTGVVEWYLRVVDTNTFDGWPEDPYAGFLPPNTTNYCGEGYVTFKVRAREDVPDGTRIEEQASIVFDYNEPIVTEPGWWNVVAQQVTVAFGEDGALGEQDYVLGTAFGELPEAGELENHVFGGWWTGQEGEGNQVTAETVVGDGMSHLYPRWVLQGSRVVFDGAGGTPGTESVVAGYGRPMPPAEGATRENHTFLGYFDAEEGGVQYYDGKMGSVTNWDRLAAEVTLYAHWGPLPYTVAFNANGGTGTMAKQAIQRDVATKLSANKFARSGYVFMGWAKTKTGAVVYANGASVKNLAASGKSVTLYARWAKKNYKVAFNANGGTLPRGKKMAAQTMTYGKAAKLRANVFTRSGYVFIGWAKTKTGAVAYANGATVKNLRTDGKTTTLYAKWAKKSYKIAYNGNGGKLPKGKTMAAQTVAYGKAVKLRANVFTRSGYVFTGWAKTKAGAVAYANAATVKNLRTDGKTQTLYAKWTNKQKVTFNANGGKCGTASKTVVIGKTYGTLPAATRADRGFMGWYTAKTGGTKVVSTTKVTAAAARTLYARWTTNQVVTFNANGGTCGTASRTYTIGKAYESLPEASMEGSGFAGWFTAAEGGTQVTAEDLATTALKRTLYAQWTEPDPAPGTTGRIAGISMLTKPGGTQPRGAAGRGGETCILVVETEPGAEYDLQWTAELGGEWETMLRWVAEEEESEVELPMAADERIGFFRLVWRDEED